MQTLEIFKAGKHVSASGQTLEFSDSDLVASAAAYSPALHEAPIVIGHPKHDAPAYGWVESIDVRDGSFLANPKQVDPEFAELVNAGKFKKISASFYSPDSPQNPVKGVYYLRHVGFLGAMPPSVKGMQSANFAEDEEGLVEYEFEFGEAVKVAQETIDFAEKEAALSAREADLAKREAKLKELEFAEYVEGLIRDGKVLPREKNQIVSALIELSSFDKEIEFAEGDQTKSMDLIEAYKASFENRPKQIEFAEFPNDGEILDLNDGELIGRKALEFAEQQQAKGLFVSAMDAVNHVIGNKK